MENSASNTELRLNAENNQYECMGDWSIGSIANLLKQFEKTVLPNGKKLTINAKNLTRLDSAGAIVLKQCAHLLENNNNTVAFESFTDKQSSLLAVIDEYADEINYKPEPYPHETVLEQIGKETYHKIEQADGLIVLIGDLCTKIFNAFHHWRQFRLTNIISNINSAGLRALPIIGLLSLLIGIVLAYQMGIQLQTYGANIFIAFLSGTAIFREFSPLITAIIVAGRTSSAFTAQIGSMKINEEIDALKTMGLSPTELLVMPKVIALLIVMPLLIFWSDVFSIIGAMVMSNLMLNVGYADFLTRLQDSVGLKQMMLGLYKAPAFAFLIAMVGCLQGLNVEPNADSLGSQTTKSVVQALFLIIITDAVFSIIYSWLDL